MKGEKDSGSGSGSRSESGIGCGNEWESVMRRMCTSASVNNWQIGIIGRWINVPHSTLVEYSVVGKLASAARGYNRTRYEWCK